MTKQQQRSAWKQEIRRQVADALKQTSGKPAAERGGVVHQASTIPVETPVGLSVHPAVRSDIRLVLILSATLVLVILVAGWLDQTYGLLDRLVAVL